MPDESFASSSTSTGITNGRASPDSANHGSSGLGLRRAATFSQTGSTRRRQTTDVAPETSFADLRRRSSNFSDFSLTDARRDLESSAEELFHPSQSTSKQENKTPLVYIPLTLALLPAVAGIFFENGSAFFTDLILLSLAAVFLHWSVTQPWDWYHSAQQLRVVKDEVMDEPVFESDSDVNLSPTSSATTALENVPEETDWETDKGKEPETPSIAPPMRHGKKYNERQASARRELYFHEMLALAWCFIFPLLGAYLLHTIRGQLTRPSEGLVSDYNLTIFLCAAEIRPVSHLIKMVQGRTLRMQRTLSYDPYAKPTISTENYQALCDRIEELETRTDSTTSGANGSSGGPKQDVSQRMVEAAVCKESRNTIQPELDALNRAMRRYEKKLTLLACQTDNRLEYIDLRLNDAIALAAVAAKNSNAQWSLAAWVMDKAMTCLLFPFQAVHAVLTFPFRTAATLFSRKKTRSATERPSRSSRSGYGAAQGKSNLDRVPARMSRR
ncbi:hypothetical protein F5Y15DRAFT_138763 [Xylariaceae sp. FL0016]|nr:hypothetical protein F5Y15DRAFT_138763 [Xylariaceae sp. FL0016]